MKTLNITQMPWGRMLPETLLIHTSFPLTLCTHVYYLDLGKHWSILLKEPCLCGRRWQFHRLCYGQSTIYTDRASHIHGNEFELGDLELSWEEVWCSKVRIVGRWEGAVSQMKIRSRVKITPDAGLLKGHDAVTACPWRVSGLVAVVKMTVCLWAAVRRMPSTG
eukprot:1138058-Pelagomonas_calceolata.AAC.2